MSRSVQELRVIEKMIAWETINKEISLTSWSPLTRTKQTLVGKANIFKNVSGDCLRRETYAQNHFLKSAAHFFNETWPEKQKNKCDNKGDKIHVNHHMHVSSDEKQVTRESWLQRQNFLVNPKLFLNFDQRIFYPFDAVVYILITSLHLCVVISLFDKETHFKHFLIKEFLLECIVQSDLTLSSIVIFLVTFNNLIVGKFFFYVF